MVKFYGANASPFVRKAMAALLLVIALALLPGAALSEADPDDAGNAGDADAPGEVEATTDASIWDASSEADPNLIEADTPAGEPPLPEHGGGNRGAAQHDGLGTRALSLPKKTTL